ncbi:MAG: PDZ domain-containing protein [Synechococcaceae cyanobacterium SM2_3_2]|nr:PDZ domain-containing protein [Synechococcaceae cyanobacterium SM2_3_2]
MKKAAQLIGLALVLPAALVLAESSSGACTRSRSTVESAQESTTVYYYNNVSNQSRNSLLPVAVESRTEPYGFIGVAIEPLDATRAREVNGERGLWSSFFSGNSTLPEVEGVLIVRTLEQGPAALAGLTDGDVILGVNGEMVMDVQRVQQIISSIPVNHQLPVTFQRGNRVMSTMIQAGDGRYLRPMMMQ